MADSNEVLGISGQLDISQIQTSLDNLSSSLKQIGVDADSLSQDMSKALDRISQSNVDMNDKVQQSMAIISQSMKDAQANMQRYADTVANLKDRMSQSQKGTAEYEELNNQLSVQQKLFIDAQTYARGLDTVYSELTREITSLTEANIALSGASAVATNSDSVAAGGNAVAKGANTAANIANSTSLLSEASSHQANSESVVKETEIVNENSKAKAENYAYTQEEKNVVDGLLASLELYIQKAQDGTITEKEYQKAIEEGNRILSARREKSREYGNVQDSLLSSMYDGSASESDKADFSSAHDAQAAEEHASSAIIDSLNKLEAAYNAVSAAKEKTKESTSQEVEATKVDAEAIAQQQEKVDALTQKCQELLEQRQKLLAIGDSGFQLPPGGADLLANMGLTFGSERLESLQQLNETIKETQAQAIDAKQKLDELTAASENANDASSKNEESHPFANYAETIQNIKAQLVENKQALAEYNAEAAKLDNLRDLTDKQKKTLNELNGKINETTENIKKLQEELRAKEGETFVGSLNHGLEKIKDKFVEVGVAIKDGVLYPFQKLGETIGNSNFGERFAAEFNQVKSGISSVASGYVDIITGHGKLQSKIADLNKALGGMGIPLAGALTGVKAVTKALWGMCSTPIGAVLAAIILGLKMVQTWMTKSANGQRVYTKLMAYFGSITKTVTDVVVILGEWLYHAFTDANGPLKDFGTNMVTTFKAAASAVGNIIKGLYHSLKGLFTLDWDLAWEGIQEIGSGIGDALHAFASAFKTQVSLVTGAVKTIASASMDKNLSANLSKAISNFGKNADSSSQLAGEQLDSQKDLAEAGLREKDYDTLIAQKRDEVYKLTGKEKDDKLNEIRDLLNKKYNTYDEIVTDEKGNKKKVTHVSRLDAQKKQLEIFQKQMQLHPETITREDYAKERELKMAIKSTEEEKASATRVFTRMQEANKRKMEASARSEEKAALNAQKKAARDAIRDTNKANQLTSANEKYDDVTYENINAREKVVKELESKLADAKISAMREGFEKTLVERKRQQEKELNELDNQENSALNAERERQKKEFEALQAIRKAKGLKVEKWDNENSFKENETTKAINEYYAQLRALTVSRQLEDERKVAESLVKSHQSYTDKKLAIDKKYKEDIASINAAIKEAEERYDKESVEALQRSKNQTTADYGKEKMKLGFEELKNSPEYVAAFTDIDKASTSTLNKLLSRFEEVKEGAAAALDPTSAKTYFDTISNLVDELVKRDPIGMAKQLSEQIKIQQEQLEQAEQILSRVQSGGQIMKSWKIEKTDDDTLQLVPVYYTLAEAEELVAQKSQEVANNQSKITKAQKQTAKEIQNLISAFKSLGSAIGGEAGQIINLIGEIGSFVITASNAMNSVSETASKAIQTLEKASAILTVIAGAIQIMSKITSLFKTADDYYTQYAKKQQEINKLRETVDDYRASVIKARQEEQNWFATTSLQNLKDKWASNAQAEENYYHTLYEAQEQYRDKSSGLSKYGIPIAGAIASVAIGAVTGGLGSLVTALGTSLGSALATTAIVGAAAAISGYATNAAAQAAISKITYQNGQTAAINNLRIQTQHKSFWRGQKTEDLRDWVRENLTDDLGNPAELFDEQGLVNLEVANAVLDKYGDKLTGETKETLEKLVEQREKIDEYIEELQSYVSDTYSPLVDDMTDAIWSWLAEGKDALAEFKNSASSTFQDIGKEMIKQMLLKTVFDGFQDKLTDLYKQYAAGSINDTQLAEQMGSIMGTVVDSMNTELPGLEKFAENYRDILAKYGFDVTGNTEQSATSKGVTSITYDQANLLVNLATARNISLEKGNEVRQQILEALINQGYVATDTIPATTDSSSQIIVDTSDNSSDAQAALYESLLKGFSNYDTDIAETTQGGDLKSYFDSANALLSQMASEYNSNMLSNSTLLAMMYSQQEMGIDISGLRVSATQMQSDISVMRDIQEQGLTQINKIELNTRPISEILETLNDIYRYQRDNM